MSVTPTRGGRPLRLYHPLAMTPEQLTLYLHEAIPLSKAMEVAATATSAETTTVTAPHGPNINHQGTVFGGSLSALALLAGFAAVLNRLRAEEHKHRVVILRNAYSYDLPAETDVTATAYIDPDRWLRFDDALSRRGLGRITIDVTVTDTSGRQVGRLAGVYAALPEDGP